MSKLIAILGLITLMALPAHAADRTIKPATDPTSKSTTTKSTNSRSTQINTSASMTDRRKARTNTLNPIRWKTFPQTSKQNPLVLNFCETKVIRIATTGGWGDVNLSDLAVGEKWNDSSNYTISGHEWSYNKVSTGGSSNYLDPQPDIASAASSPAADVTYDIRRNKNMRPTTVSGFGGKSYKKAREGRITLRLSDSQNQHFGGTIYFEYRLHNNMAKVDPPKIEKLSKERHDFSAGKSFPLHKVSFSARYNGCTGEQIDNTIISAKVIDPKGQKVEGGGSSGMSYELIAMPGQYTVTIVDNGQELSRPYKFSIL